MPQLEGLRFQRDHPVTLQPPALADKTIAAKTDTVATELDAFEFATIC
jgi:hypothetical protein